MLGVAAAESPGLHLPLGDRETVAFFGVKPLCIVTAHMALLLMAIQRKLQRNVRPSLAFNERVKEVNTFSERTCLLGVWPPRLKPIDFCSFVFGGICDSAKLLEAHCICHFSLVCVCVCVRERERERERERW